jgi:hypothetical protein
MAYNEMHKYIGAKKNANGTEYWPIVLAYVWLYSDIIDFLEFVREIL